MKYFENFGVIFPLLLLVIMIIFLCIVMVAMILDIKEFKRRTKNDTKLPVKTTNFETDIQCLDRLIADQLQYMSISAIPLLTGKNKTLTSKDVDELISSAVVSVLNNISDSYKDTLHQYIEEIDLYIAIKLKSLLDPYFVEHNLIVLKGGTAMTFNEYINKTNK